MKLAKIRQFQQVNAARVSHFLDAETGEFAQVGGTSYELQHALLMLESAWRNFILCGVVQDVPVVFHCFPCQGESGYFPP